ncbi:DUF1858 domain-containing protein [Chelativorans sp. AA-79]|uniref:DUF1858 domain-containing protein n=1 Tax=Chelativorans sp. AA-79 TaxID=3028735 RepID=UPI0023F9A444|nr:DUF1858 domain-containing protein [Chelativorans sp. AA-79]WEX08562.1 DUF1858 domain-containing protein [Chelativorans sp. AA-79]
MPMTPDHYVDDVMRRWPETIRVFLNYRMHCVGCPIGRFHTLADACREHGIDLDHFLADLRVVIRTNMEHGGIDGN